MFGKMWKVKFSSFFSKNGLKWAYNPKLNKEISKNVLPTSRLPALRMYVSLRPCLPRRSCLQDSQSMGLLHPTGPWLWGKSIHAHSSLLQANGSYLWTIRLQHRLPETAEEGSHTAPSLHECLRDAETSAELTYILGRRTEWTCKTIVDGKGQKNPGFSETRSIQVSLQPIVYVHVHHAVSQRGSS